jgi:S-adenosylmethionine:tRNA ribosyltransferase-isomerase
METLLSLSRAGIDVARVTHAAGLSSTGDADIDARLPLPEQWYVPRETAALVKRARDRGGRIIAVGTSAVRALESAAASGTFEAGEGITDLVLGASSRRRVVDAVLTGVHEKGTSHHALLRAFQSEAVLDHAIEASDRAGLLSHEFGDAWLVFGIC